MLRVLAVGLAALSAFFVFYTVRLLAVTQLLQHTRAGGQRGVHRGRGLSHSCHRFRLGRRALLAPCEPSTRIQTVQVIGNTRRIHHWCDHDFPQRST